MGTLIPVCNVIVTGRVKRCLVAIICGYDEKLLTFTRQRDVSLLYVMQ